jgi:4'-phosphopantetheinyl transferase
MDRFTTYFLLQNLADLPADDCWLAAGERARVAGMRFPKRRNDWLLGRWTAKRALRSFLSLHGQEAPDYAALEIRSAPDGAPEALFGPDPAPVSIALSHSDGQGFCVVAPPGIAVGCDLENVPRGEWAFLEDYFVAEERRWIERAPADAQPFLATLIWSAKESALKCLREGLRRDTRTVQIHAGDEKKPGWNEMTVQCLQSSRVYYAWWRSIAGRSVQTVAADSPAYEPVELLI